MSRAAALEDDLRAQLGESAILSGAEVTGRSAGIWGPPRNLEARLLVRPVSTSEVSVLLARCHAAGQTVVTHGGLTGVVDGTWAGPDDLILSTERMRVIEEIDTVGRTMTVQAGVTLEAVQQAAAAAGLMFPLDLGARGSATIGGNAATNAGGNRVIRYGMIRDSILGLEAVLADGTVVSSLNGLLKNNAGYDLKQLFVGSEGTLGVITRLVLRLRPQPASQHTALAVVPDFGSMVSLLQKTDAALGGTLSAFEALWGEYYDFIVAAQGHAPLPDGQPFYVLLEMLGADPEGDAERFADVLAAMMEEGLASDIVLAKSDGERERLWGVRDDVVQLLTLEPMFLFDVSLPLREMEAYTRRLRSALIAHWSDARLYIFGHLGDGNLHLGISAGTPDGAGREEVEALVYGPLEGYRGSVSAEHGIGLEKKPWLDRCRSAGEIALMRSLKRSLDPGNILNPGKIFDV